MEICLLSPPSRVECLPQILHRLKTPGWGSALSACGVLVITCPEAGAEQATGCPQLMQWGHRDQPVPAVDSPWDTQLPCPLPGLSSRGQTSLTSCLASYDLFPHLCLGTK